jgi:hypothetical protein
MYCLEKEDREKKFKRWLENFYTFLWVFAITGITVLVVLNV